MPISRRRRRIRRPISMSASPADRGLSLVKLDLGLDFLLMQIILQPKGDGKGGLGDFYSYLGWDYRTPTSPRVIIRPPDQAQTLAVDHLAVLHDRNVNARAALGVDQLIACGIVSGYSRRAPWFRRAGRCRLGAGLAGVFPASFLQICR